MSDPTGPRWPTIPQPGTDPLSMLESVERLKEAMELLTGQRGFDETYSVDNNFRTLRKELGGLSAVFSERIELAVNQYGALVERTTALEVRSDDMDARIIEVDTASIDRDGALATSIDIVQASVDDVSAGGYFKTVAAVSGGALASMEAQVYTTDAKNVTVTAGWRVKIEAGVSYFDIYSANWRLIDNAGVPKPVMEYSSGKFRFTGDVAINGNLVVIGTIDNPQLANLGVTYQKIYPNAATQGAGAIGSSGRALTIMSLRGSSQVVIFVNVAGAYEAISSALPTSVTLYINGGVQRTWSLSPQPIYSGGTDAFGDLIVSGYYTSEIGGMVLYTVPADGSYTIELSVHNGGTEYNVFKQLVAIELAR